jgi:hypothetical protein
MATTTYVPIETYTLGSAASSVTFGSGGTIPQTYTDLVIIGNTKNTANNGDEVGIRFNADTGSNYSRTRLYGNGSSATGDRSSNTNKGALQINSTSDFTPFIAHIQNYSNSTTYKTVISRGNSTGYASAYASLWRNTNAVTSITILPDSGTTFVAGSTFTLYGIANAQIKAPKATGGIITYDSTYFYHTFGASGTFTPQQSLTADVLVVAGGGSGGLYGGGGAGGLRAFASQSLTTTAYTCTIGAGGSSANGGASSFAGSGFTTINATGGGRGGLSGANGLAGGSGGGGGAAGGTGGGSSYSGGAGNAGSYSPVEGFAGGNNWNQSGAAPGGGGGGAGGVGGNASAGVGGAGGIGATSSLITSIVTSAGVGQLVSSTGYIAGGGGGGVESSAGTAAGAGGAGGGGAGGLGAAGQNGSPNSGGGGGSYGGSGANGNGGSGVVIIRYLKA